MFFLDRNEVKWRSNEGLKVQSHKSIRNYFGPGKNRYGQQDTVCHALEVLFLINKKNR